MQPLIRTDLCSAHIYTHTYTYTCTIYVDIQNTKTQNQIIDTQLQPLTQTYTSNQRVGGSEGGAAQMIPNVRILRDTHTRTHKCAINTSRNSAQLTLIDASIIIIPTFFYLSYFIHTQGRTFNSLGTRVPDFFRIVNCSENNIR